MGPPGRPTALGRFFGRQPATLFPPHSAVVAPPRDVADGTEKPAPDPAESDEERREREAAERRRAARALTVFLDVVAMHAERDAPHLL
ncbi:hypothetical protein, partial [Cellulosimicrobium sp. Marseille-Q4280]|uniref:hypothetical protein n=1 Tax=Cellulosimicrobium sp. Marseille-Q4280 TaxID=2937992 RepID=UPI00203FD495